MAGAKSFASTVPEQVGQAAPHPRRGCSTTAITTNSKGRSRLPPATFTSRRSSSNRRAGRPARRVPSMRVAAPLIAADGRRFAIVIADLDLRPVFDRIRATARQGSRIYVVNEAGDFLLH